MTHAPGQRPASRTIEIRADTIGFYSGVVVVGADGHVRILEGSREIDADYARYDFQHDRLLATGNVTVLTNLGSFSCAAYSHDRAAQTTYYISLDPEPRAMRFTGNDPSKAISAPPPSGIFDAYDLAGARPYFKGRHAVIIPHTNVRISPAEFPSGAGPSFEVPTYLQTVSTNPNIGVEAEPSASFDQPFNVFGSPGALTQIHLRYDTVTGAGIGIEQHLVDQIRSYLVVSALVIGVHREDLASYINAGSHVNANLTAYHTTTDNYLQYRMTHGSHLENEQLVFNQFDGNASADLTISSYTNLVRRLFSYKFFIDYGHDNFPGVQPYPNVWRTTLGGSLFSPPGLKGPYKSDLSLEFDAGSTTFDYPHQNFTSTFTATLSREIVRKLRLFTSAQFQQSDQRYRNNGPLYLGLPNPSSPFLAPNGAPFPGYFAYIGLGTNRTYTVSTIYTPSVAFNLTSSLQYAHDFPPQFGGSGRPPLTASFDLFVRPGPTLGIEFGRSYTFGWNGQYFAPSYTFRITP